MNRLIQRMIAQQLLCRVIQVGLWGVTVLLLCFQPLRAIAYPQNSHVNSCTINYVKWNLSASCADGTDPRIRQAVDLQRPYVSDAYTDAQNYFAYTNITITGFHYSDAKHVKNLRVPGMIDWDTNGSAGVLRGTVRNIASSAFYKNTDIETVTLDVVVPLQEIGTPCFRECKNLTSIDAGNGTPYNSIDGVLYKNNTTVLVKYPEGKEGRFFAVPATVKELAPYSLANTKLDTVLFSGERPAVPDTAFDGRTCSSMAVRDGVLTEVYDAQWDEDLLINVVIIPDGIVSIGPNAFSEHLCGTCLEVTIPNSVHSIGEEAFAQIVIVNDRFAIPISVNEIGKMAFNGCEFMPDTELVYPTGGQKHWPGGVQRVR